MLVPAAGFLSAAVYEAQGVDVDVHILSDVDVNVHLKDCRGVIVLDNTFWAGFRHDLLIEDSTNIVVGPNNLDRNPRYSAEDRGRANRGGTFFQVPAGGVDICNVNVPVRRVAAHP